MISLARQQELLAADYSASPNIDALYALVSSEEIKMLYNLSPSFKARVDEFDVVEGVAVLSPEEQAVDAQKAEEEAAAQAEADAAAQIEADRLAAEETAVNQAPMPVDPVEELYDGVEKLQDGQYSLTVDPGDGSPLEVFYGTSQKECFKALRKSKANATKELRRRQKQVKITDDLRALEVERINYTPLVAPLRLTPDEIFDLTEKQKDPTTVLEATRKLRQASLTQEECDRMNATEVQRRYIEQKETAIEWINQNPEFYSCPENIVAIQKLMGGLNWAVTVKNLDRAFEELRKQGVLLDEPETQSTFQPAVQPASVVPVTVAPASKPAIQAPVAPAGVLPAANKVLRPGSSSTSAMPTRRIENAGKPASTVVLTVEEYHSMSAATMKQRMNREPAFRAAVDALIAAGKI